MREAGRRQTPFVSFSSRLPYSTRCHTFRATTITAAYLENGGTLEKAQAIHRPRIARTTKLYDRTSNALTLKEIERIAI